jgi:hypothetical protein
MTADSVKHRLEALEAEVARLRKEVNGAKRSSARVWLEDVWGRFNDSPDFNKAVRAGRRWREAFRPKPRRSRGRKLT